MTRPPELVISTGDPQGIGPEISVRAARLMVDRQPSTHVVLAGDPEHLQGLFGGELPHCPQGAAEAGGVSLLPVPITAALDKPPPSAGGGAAALAFLEAALTRVRGGDGRALVTAPVSKVAVTACGAPFSGHTGWLADRLGAERVVMLFVAGSRRVALATVHVPLREVPLALSQEGLVGTLEILESWLRDPVGISEPKIAVLGLNPHAGEDGLLGSEERELITPAIDAFNLRGGLASGPHSADSFFRRSDAVEVDAVLAMYHDQGLISMKGTGQPPAVNITLGLPLIRTSVDHGCAFSLAGQGTADPSSLLAALKCARELL